MKVVPIVKAKRPIPFTRPLRPRRYLTRLNCRQVAEQDAHRLGWRERHEQWLAQQPKSVLYKMEQDKLKKERDWVRSCRNNSRDARTANRAYYNDLRIERSKPVPPPPPPPLARWHWDWPFPPINNNRLDDRFFIVNEETRKKVAECEWYYPPLNYVCRDVTGNIIPGDDPRWESPPWSNYAYRKKEILDAKRKKITVFDVEGTPKIEREFIPWRRATILSYLKDLWIEG